jgi:glycine cleavage system H protein
MSEYLETTIDKFVFRVAADRLFSPEGVWVQAKGNRVRVGLADYVQQRNGDVTFAHVRAVGAKLAAGDELAEVETVKANASVFSPVSGAVLEVNPALELNPEVINEGPYDKGWLAVLESTDWESDKAKLLDPAAYLVAMKLQAERELNGS